MADWNEPTTATAYTAVLSELKGRDTDSALLFDPAFITPTNIATNTIRWNSVNSYFEKYGGVSWAILDSDYAINVATVGGLAPSAFLRLTTGGTQTLSAGKLIINYNTATALDLRGGTADNVYIQFMPDASAVTTSRGYIGYFGAATEDLSIVNQYTNGDILLTTNGTGELVITGDVAMTGSGELKIIQTSAAVWAAELYSNTPNRTVPVVQITQASSTGTSASTALEAYGYSTASAIWAQTYHATGLAASFFADIAARTQPVVEIINENATGAGGSGLYIRNDAAGDALYSENNHLNGAAGYFYTAEANRTKAVVIIESINATGGGTGLEITNNAATGYAIDVIAGDSRFAGDIIYDSIVQPKVKIVDIGNWDMTFTTTVNVAHGLTQSTIRSIVVVIRNDSQNLFQLDVGPTYGSTQTGSWSVGATNVTLNVVGGSAFDSSLYNNPSFNRGWMTIFYV